MHVLYLFHIISVIKENIDELKADLLSEIKELIHLEVEKFMKKQKEELQVRVTKLEHAHNDLEQHVCHVCSRVKDRHAANDKTADKVLEKF